MSSQEQLLARLEAAVARLESLGSGAPAKKAASGDEMDDASASGRQAYDDFEKFYNEKIPTFLKSFEPYEDLKNQKELLAKAWANQFKLMKANALCKKPTDQELLAFLQPEVDAINACSQTDYKSKQRDHQQALADLAPFFSWPFSKPTFQHVEAMRDAAAMYLNRVLTAAKDADEKTKTEARAFAAALKDTLTAYAAFLKENFKMGLEWNPQGKDLKAWSTGAAAPAPAAAAAPAAAVAPAAAPVAAPAKGAVFSELSQGLGVTSGLKKVTDDMKAKNQKDLPPAQPIKPKVVAKEEPKASKPASCQQQGESWYCEWQWNNASENITIEITKLTQGVYIGNCRNTTITIKGKPKSVTVDKSFRTTVIVEEFLSTVEIVNCDRAQVNIVGAGGKTYAIDKSKGCILNMSTEALAQDADIVTSNISECNVQIPGRNEDEVIIEMAIPEQYIHKVRKGSGKVPFYVDATANTHQ